MAPVSTPSSGSPTDSDTSMFRLPKTPSMPLFALSPEKVQNIRLPQSPSLPNILEDKPLFSPGKEKSEDLPSSPLSATRHGVYMLDGRPQLRTTSSEVQSMVARFNSLDIKDHAEMRKRDAAALRRAQMGREEAEAALKKVREEYRRLEEDHNEGKERERKVMKRLDAVMDDLHRAKETHQHAQSLYEKEIRRARKEAFKASSAMVKLQEELKSTRATFKVAQADLDMERMKCSRRDQEAFNAQYELVGVQEQLSKAEALLRVVEEERDALKTNLKEEEVARVAAEGRIALPPPREEDDEFMSPKKRAPIRNVDHVGAAKASLELEDLREEITRERLAREHAEEQVNFMKMECQFGCCSCRLAESQRRAYVHDHDFPQIERVGVPALETEANVLESMEVDEELPPYPAAARARLLHTQTESYQNEAEDLKLTPVTSHAESDLFTLPDEDHHMESDEHIDDKDSTACATPTPTKHTCADPAVSTQASSPLASRHENEQHQLDPPVTPAHANFRTVTTTTTIPLAPSTPAVDKSHNFAVSDTPVAMSISREEAMEQIRQRRGRARSIAGTPKRAASQSRATPRRDISAPEYRRKAGVTATPKTTGKAGASFK